MAARKSLRIAFATLTTMVLAMSAALSTASASSAEEIISPDAQTAAETALVPTESSTDLPPAEPEAAAQRADASAEAPDHAEQPPEPELLPASPSPSPSLPSSAEEQAAPATSAHVANATLEWGVKASFRNYIYNFAMFEGKTTLLGNTAQPVAKGAYNWSGGVGSADSEGASADVSFGEGNGVHFQSHPMDVDGETAYALDIQFTNPRVVVTSASTGELHMDVVGHEFVDVTTVGAQYTMDDVTLATLALPAPTAAEDTLTWSGATATLTANGSKAFGGFYKTGDALDPLTFSTGGSISSPVAATTTQLNSSADTIAEGSPVTFTATVTPANAAGSVQFFDAASPLGAETPVDNGNATYTSSSLAIGSHPVTAVFTPADASVYAPSQAAELTVVVSGKHTDVPSKEAVSGATLSWGVKATFRNYIYNFTAFEGQSTLIGETTQATAKGVFQWAKGTGTAMNDGSVADVSFGKNDGVRFQSHPMGDRYALDLQFTNPRVVITSPSAGELRMDVVGHEFESMDSIGESYTLTDVKMATLALSSPSQKDGALVWTDASATLTADGAEAFGGFYDAGEALDPLTFTFPIDSDVIVKTPTATTLSVSTEKITVGENVTLSVKVAPKINGTVTFVNGTTPMGTPQRVVGGMAEMVAQNLPVGKHSVTANFEPSDDTFGHSVSQTVTLTVDEKPKPPAPAAPVGDQAAGSLNWGISSGFVDYTTNPNRPGGKSGGKIVTSGVGSGGGGYVFPQASSGSWDLKSQTGSIQYSGTVTFTAHKGLMNEVFSNPTITVTSASRGSISVSGRTFPLNLGSASKTVGAHGEVTWSNVPVSGSISGGSGGSGGSLAIDPLTFTVGSTSQAVFGSTAVGGDDKPKRTAKATVPTTAGITVLTDAEKIKAGGRIEIEAAGFDPNDEGVLVVLYGDDGSGPVVLDEDASANARGLVTWSGTLPKDIAGTHTITLQGSIDAGAKVTMIDADAVKKAADNGSKLTPTQQAQSAGIVDAASSGAGMAAWEWWASAGGLAAIAGCMTLLVMRQRKLSR